MKIQIEQLDLLTPWPQLVLRDGYGEMRILVRLGNVALGQITTRPIRKRAVPHRRLRRRVARELSETLLQTLAQEGLAAGPNALKWFMPAAWASFSMSTASPRARQKYVEEHFLLPSGLASPLREWVIESQQREPSWPMPAVTVALCTRDRESTLEEAIRALQQLDYPSFDILVINNSADPVPTAEIARRMGVACARCKTPGVSHARNDAIAHTTSKWIAFIDDDCRPEKNWLRELVRPAQDANCRAVVGRVVPARIESAAEIVFDMYERRGGQGAGGANMLLHRQFAQQIGGFDLILGQGPRSLGGGEDIDILQRIRRARFAAHEAPRALVHHHRVVSARALRHQIAGRAAGHATVVLRRCSFLQWARHFLTLIRETRTALAGRTRYPFSLVLLEMKGTLTGPMQYAWAKLARTLRPPLRPHMSPIMPGATSVAQPSTPLESRRAA